MAEDKRTPLAEVHEASGGKMVSFSGWWMPVQYKGIREEHLNVRENVGLFDVSHMGEIWVEGEKALETLQWITTNDVSKLEPGDAQYSLFGNLQGGVVDDLIVYCFEKNTRYMLCVNAANIEKDFAWVQKNNRGADIRNASSDWGQIAVQGPKAIELVTRVFGDEAQQVGSFKFLEKDFSGEMCILARTGYTGEEGFEIFVPAGVTASLWQELVAKGEDLQAAPVGLGARDTLRTEMKYSLYGHEIDDTSNPYAAGLGWVVKPKGKDFLGKEAMLEGKEEALASKLIGFVMLDRGIPRHGYRLISFDNKEIGKVTSGTVSPSLGENIGIGYVDKAFAEEGSEILVEIRNNTAKAKVVKTPFYRK